MDGDEEKDDDDDDGGIRSGDGAGAEAGLTCPVVTMTLG